MPRHTTHAATCATRHSYSECDRFAPYCEVGEPRGLNGTLRVGLAQVASNSMATLEENAAKHVAWIEKSAAEGARVVLFPEVGL